MVAVFTQPDRPAGRGRRPRPSPIKRLAVAYGIEVHQPRMLRGYAPMLAALHPDVMVVVAYGLLLPPEILAVPELGCVNVHASLLPRWRGAAPIPRAIEAGDVDTGVTIMLMDEGLDTGPTLAVSNIAIGERDTAGTVHDRLAMLGSELLADTLLQLEQGLIQPVAQDSKLATHAPKLSKQESRIDWSQSATGIARRIRAFNPWPVAYGCLRGQRVRFLNAVVSDQQDGHPPGTVVSVGDAGIEVSCGCGSLILTELQREGGKQMPAQAFVNGFPLIAGEQFDVPSSEH